MRHTVFTLAITTLLLSCSNAGLVISADSLGTTDTIAEDGATNPDVHKPDTSLIPDLPEFDLADILFFETVPDIPTLNCLPGEGCFLDNCSENSDCQSGWCVEHMGEAVCSQSCIDECPQGWICKQVGASDPDLVFVCVSNHSNLCKPCADAIGCKAVGGAEDVCVDYAAEGSFCGGGCTADSDCPWGFSCLTTVTVDGIDTLQCVADAGSCPCTGKSVSLALFTPCERTNEFGACVGMRVCEEAGLSDCDAPLPSTETCNGLDDDCDGFEDEPDEVGGDFINLCDDGNECTSDTCDGEAGCSYQLLDQGECKDGDPCTAADNCQAGICVGNPVVCDDDDPCTDDSCDGSGGCHFEDNLADCDDGNPCTVADQCEAGECAGTAIPCDCQSDDDCDALEDGDLCNGTLICNTLAWPYECEVDPETVVTCPAPEPGPDAICLTAACATDSGECSLIPDHEDFACEDGDECTLGDICTAGICAAGEDRVCNDGNPCTDDSCDPEAGCVFTHNEATCNDGNVCTTEDLCVAGECTGGSALVCDDNDLCNGSETCDPATGCQLGESLQCNDKDICNGFESCHAVDGCLSGISLSCDDGNSCTDDSCHPESGCHHTANQLDCDAGNECTLSDKCIDGVCKAGLPLACDDDNICTSDSCNPAAGCVYTMNQAPCDDSDLCTTGDHCHLGECIGSGSLTCDDKNLCTDDSCLPESGCEFTFNDSPCDDQNACTQDDHCSEGWCAPGTPIVCSDDNPCTDDTCDFQTGCQTAPNTAPCEDGSLCTSYDTCANSTCVPGPAIDCDDDNLCTDDSCDPDTGCVNDANNIPCDDSNACTTDDQCADKSCQPGQSIDCDDSNPCTTDGCAVESGCTHMNVDDETSCGQDKICMAGECVDSQVHGDQSFSYTGSQQSFTVPDGVNAITVEAFGGQGGAGAKGAAGKGGKITTTLAVTPGQTLYVYVGGQGAAFPASTEGWNGGGKGGTGSCGPYGGGGGGGASDVRVGGTALGNRVIVAGGAGGGGGDGTNSNPLYGGAGGGATGGNGQPGTPFGGGCDASGHGGTQGAGGAQGKWACAGCNATDGSLGQGGNGNTSTGCGGICGGGGGGGGYYGGGGGGLGAGGGGSSYAGAGTSNVSHTQGVQDGNGRIELTW